MPDRSQAAVKVGSYGGPSSRLGYRLWQTQHAVERAMESALEPLGIGVTQVAALLHLKLQPGLSGAELARRMLITPQSTATLLSNLEARGWVRRSPHAIHRALVEAHLTDAGQAILEQGEATLADTDEAVADGLDPQTRKALIAALNTCLANARLLSERRRAAKETKSWLAP